MYKHVNWAMCPFYFRWLSGASAERILNPAITILDLGIFAMMPHYVRLLSEVDRQVIQNEFLHGCRVIPFGNFSSLHHNSAGFLRAQNGDQVQFWFDDIRPVRFDAQHPVRDVKRHRPVQRGRRTDPVVDICRTDRCPRSAQRNKQRIRTRPRLGDRIRGLLV